MYLQRTRRKISGAVCLAGFSLILSGCTGWTGLLPERYDGRLIERNEEVNAAYHENQEIIGEGKEWYLLEPFSEEILAPSLPFSQAPSQQMEPGVYTAGEDFPEGRYRFLYAQDAMQNGPMNNATLRVTDSDGQLILQELLSPMSATLVEVDLKAGNIVSLAGEEFPVKMGTEALPEQLLYEMGATPEADVILYTGIWEVGEQIEAGTYTISQQPPTGFLYVFEESIEPRIYQFAGTVTFDSETGDVITESGELNLTLEDGQKIYVKDTGFPLSLMREE